MSEKEPLPAWKADGVFDWLVNGRWLFTALQVFIVFIWSLTVAGWVLLNGYSWPPIVLTTVLMVMNILVTRLVHIQTRHMGRLQQALDDHVDRKERLYGLVRHWTKDRRSDETMKCASDLNHVLGDRDLEQG